MFPLQSVHLSEFLACRGLSQRLIFINRVVGQRLYSPAAAAVWLEVMRNNAHRIDEDQLEILLRELLHLAPYHPEAETFYAAIMRPRVPAPAGGAPVFMVTSCQKYLTKAIELRNALRGAGAQTCTVIGQARVQLPQWQDGVCALPVEDSYEALPMKVLAGVAAITQRFGAVPVVKIDDDCRLTPQFDAQHFAELAQRFDYVGTPCGHPMHDRCWHVGKAQGTFAAYTRRFHGKWARGLCYLMSPRAAALVAREFTFFPDEFAGEYYEDKMIGDFMRRQGIVLHTLADHAEWGVSVDLSERYVTPPSNP